MVGPCQCPRYNSAVKPLTKPPSTTGTRQEHDPHQNFLIMAAEQRLNVTKLCISKLFVVTVEPVWLFETQLRLS